MGNVLEFFVKMKDLMSSGLAKVAQNATTSFGKVQAQVNEVHKGLDKVKDKVNEVDRAANNSSFFSGRLFKSLAVGAAAMAAVSFAGGTIKKAMDFGATKQSFQVLTGDKGKGESLANELNKLQQDTILGPSVFKNAQTMMGFGIAADKVVPTLKMLGDVSMGDEARLGSLTLAFSQVSAAGKLTGQDLLQMVNAGFNPLKDISQMTGTSISDLKKKMEDGAISFEMVTQAFEHATGKGGLYNNMLNTLAETPFGKLQQLQGQFESFQVKIGEALMPLAEVGLGLMGTLMQVAEGVLPSLVAGVLSITEGFSALLSPTGQWAFYMEFAKTILTIIWNGVSYVVGAIWNIVKGVFQWAAKSEIIMDAFRVVADVADVAFIIIKKIADVLSWLWNSVLKPVLDAIEAAYRWVKNVLGLGGQEIKVVGEVNGNIKNTSVSLAAAGQGAATSVTPGKIPMGAGFGNAGGGMKAAKDETARGIAGGGPRSITINLGKFFDNLVLNTVSMGEGEAQIQQNVEALFLRILNSGAAVQG